MAVTESKGDGYALYNGVKLPSLPEYDTGFYSNAVIITYEETTTLLVCHDVFGADGITVTPNEPQHMKWECSAEGWGHHEVDTVSVEYRYDKLVWTNTGIEDWENWDGNILEASDPIPLDGMNVIEWDGDTEGVEASTIGIGNAYCVAKSVSIDVNRSYVRVLATGATTKATLSDNGVYYSGSHVFVSHSYDVEFRKTISTHVCLFAYYPIEEEPKTATITYETEHGSAPASKTVTFDDGESFALTADDLPVLSADGYLFGGWSVNGQIVSAGYAISADTTLTAVWVEDLPVSKIDPLSLFVGWKAGNWVARQRGKA